MNDDPLENDYNDEDTFEPVEPDDMDDNSADLNDDLFDITKEL